MTRNLPFDIRKLSTTHLGRTRIARNLKLDALTDPLYECREIAAHPDARFERRGKNWYVTALGCQLTVNASSLNIITAKRI